MSPGRWEFHNPTRIVAGTGALHELGDLVQGRVLLVTSPGATQRGLTDRIVAIVGAGRVLVHDRVASNPGVELLDRSIDELRGEDVDAVVAVGGGSAIDTGKVLSLALAMPASRVHDLVDAAPNDDIAPVPLVAVPTTAGTGSEVTPFATVWDTSAQRKLSVGGVALYPHVALIDPMLSVGLEWDVTLSTGLDAYVQCFEAICNRHASTVTTAFAERGLGLVPDALRTLKDDLGAIDARVRMAEAALLSGLAISNTRTALAHSMSYPITARLGVPHGLACALVLPAVLEFNLEADDGRLDDLAHRSGLAGSDELLGAVIDLYRYLDVARALGRYLGGLEPLSALAPEMLTPARADNNLRPADEDAVCAILRRTVDLVGVAPVR